MDAIWEGRNQKGGGRREESKGWAERPTLSVSPVQAQHLSTYPAGNTHKDLPHQGLGYGCSHGMS